MCSIGVVFCLRRSRPSAKECVASVAPARLDGGNFFGRREGALRPFWFRRKPAVRFCAGKQHRRGHRYQCENGSPHHHGNPNPLDVVFSPETNKLFAGSSRGKLYIYDGTSFDLLKEIDFHSDVDNLRYDAANKRVYVGYGEDETGAIGAVDATTNERLDEEYKLGAHPESFQLEASGPNICANLPDLKQIAAIDRITHTISRWPITLQMNFPMALNEADRRLFVGTRAPARLAVFDTSSGHRGAALPCVLDTDDLYYDAARKRIYVAGGEGFISVFQQKDADHYQLLAKVPSALGARTAGSFGKGRKAADRFFLAVPARAGRGAEVWIYKVQD